MPLPLYNRVKMTVASAPGTGDEIALGVATVGFRSFVDAGTADHSQINYVIDDGTEYEFGFGTYDAATQTITRDVVRASSNAGSRINASTSALVYTDAYAEDFLSNRVVELREEFERQPNATSVDGTFALTGQEWTQTAVTSTNGEDTIDGAVAIKVVDGHAVLDPLTSTYDALVAAAAWVPVENPIAGVRVTFRLTGDHSDQRYTVAAWFSGETTPGVPAQPLTLIGETRAACVLWISRTRFFVSGGGLFEDSGSWAAPLELDTDYTVTFAIKDASLVMYGPRGETATFYDNVARQSAGLKVGFAVCAGLFSGLGEVSSVSVITREETLTPSPYLTPEDLAGAFPYSRGPSIVAQADKPGQILVGGATGYPSMTFGTTSIIASVTEPIAPSDVSFYCDVEFRVGSNITIGSGVNAETFAVLDYSGGQVFIDGAFANAHAVDERVTGSSVKNDFSFRFPAGGQPYWRFGDGVNQAGVYFYNARVYLGYSDNFGSGLFFGGPFDTGDTTGEDGYLTSQGGVISTGVPIRTAKGATADRPELSEYKAGAMYYDTDLSKPIWWDGTDWRDATGTVV